MNLPKKYELLLLDYDGVLANSIRVCIEEINRLRNQWPKIPEIRNRNDLTRLLSERLVPSVARFVGGEKQARMFFDDHSSAVLERAGEIEPFRVAVEALGGKLGIPIVLITSAYTDGVEKVLGKAGMTTDVFDLILDRSVRKPKSEKIRIALEQFKVHPGGACYVGDLAHDILESQEAGIAVAAVGYGYHPSWYLRRFNPDHILETENDFAPFVGKSCRTESVYHGFGNTIKNESLAINSWENEGGAHA